MHAARLVQEMKKLDPDLRFFGIGGDELADEGMELLAHLNEMNFMGFIEVIRHLPRISKIMNRLLEEIEKREAKMVIPVDYPGFNLKLLEKLAGKNYAQKPKVFYYISPQVWAWGAKRIPKIARLVDRMAGILPFETETYAGTGLDFNFVGHPLLDEMQDFPAKRDFFDRNDIDQEKKLVAFLPGSREQEVKRILPVMMGARQIIRHKIDCSTRIGAARFVNPELFRKHDDITIRGDTRSLMKHADLVITKSGTSTLETAVAGTPMVVVYKLNPVSFQIGKRLVKLDNIGLVNVVAGQRIVPELIQSQASAVNIAREAERILTDPAVQNQIRKQLDLVKSRLGRPGASPKAANLAFQLL